MAARRRQIRRRRAVALVIMVLLVVGLVVLVMPGGSHPVARPAAAQAPSAPPAAKPAGQPKPSAPKPHPGPPSAASQAAPVQRVLHYTSYVQLAGHRRRDVALTFDDGPSPYTPQVLKVLSSMHAPATFFVIGRSASAYPGLVATEVTEAKEEKRKQDVAYVVAGASSAGTGLNSAEASATPIALPPAPTGLTATPGAGKITLAWNPAAGAGLSLTTKRLLAVRIRYSRSACETRAFRASPSRAGGRPPASLTMTGWGITSPVTAAAK